MEVEANDLLNGEKSSANFEWAIATTWRRWGHWWPSRKFDLLPPCPPSPSMLHSFPTGRSHPRKPACREEQKLGAHLGRLPTKPLAVNHRPRSTPLLELRGMSNRACTETVAWKLHIPAALALRIESRVYDPTKGKPRYGHRNRLVIALLERYDRETPLPEWLQEDKLKQGQLIPSLPLKS